MIDPRIREEINKRLLTRGGYREHLETIKSNLRLIEKVCEEWPKLAALISEGVVDFDPETSTLWTFGSNPILVMERPRGRVTFMPCEYNHAAGKFEPVWHCDSPWCAFYHAVRYYREGKTPFAFPSNVSEGTA